MGCESLPTASLPSPASMTSYPADFKAKETAWRMLTESSTVRIVFGILEKLHFVFVIRGGELRRSTHYLLVNRALRLHGVSLVHFLHRDHAALWIRSFRD